MKSAACQILSTGDDWSSPYANPAAWVTSSRMVGDREMGSVCGAPSGPSPLKTRSCLNSGMNRVTGSSKCHLPCSNRIINATPVGMGNTRDTPLNADEIKAQYVFDMVYDPAETRLLRLAKERGVQVIAGSEMFVHQAARQFEIWTGKPAPREDMLRIVQLALEERAAAHAPEKSRKLSEVLP